MGHQRRARIASLAADPAGFTLRQCNDLGAKPCAKIVNDEFLAGRLHRIVQNNRWIRYFSSRAHAAAFSPGIVVELHPLITGKAPARKAGPQPAHLARKPTFQIPRGVPAPVKLKQVATIIWPVGVKHTVIPTPAPRFSMVSHSFVHGSMGVMR